jgi:hypothetical protein
MDHAKTTSPCFANRIKATYGFFKQFVSVTGQFGNTIINDSKCCGVLFGDVIENMDAFKFIYLYIDNNSIELALQD